MKANDERTAIALGGGVGGAIGGALATVTPASALFVGVAAAVGAGVGYASYALRRTRHTDGSR